MHVCDFDVAARRRKIQQYYCVFTRWFSRVSNSANRVKIKYSSVHPLRGCNGAQKIYPEYIYKTHQLVNKAVLTIEPFAGEAKEYIHEYGTRGFPCWLNKRTKPRVRSFPKYGDGDPPIGSTGEVMTPCKVMAALYRDDHDERQVGWYEQHIVWYE